MNSKTLFKELVSGITLDDEQGEIHSMVYLILEKLAGVTRSDILLEKEISLSEESGRLIEDAIQRIHQHEPVQYIIGECMFFGRRFKVNQHVLIPRPETEELITLVLSSVGRQKASVKILDIGTGSGCIPITLALEIPGADVLASDISQDALRVAEENARLLRAPVRFIHHDILNDAWPVADLDVVISNPPYVTDAEKPVIRKNVLNYEPHLALFVPDDDPLIFFKKILTQLNGHVKPGAKIFFEIHESMGGEMEVLMKTAGLVDVNIHKDISGHDRLASGVYPAGRM